MKDFVKRSFEMKRLHGSKSVSDAVEELAEKVIARNATPKYILLNEQAYKALREEQDDDWSPDSYQGMDLVIDPFIDSIHEPKTISVVPVASKNWKSEDT